MKRWPLRICVLLLLGAIVNVAVAWGCALMLDPQSMRVDYQDHVLGLPPFEHDLGGASLVLVTTSRVDDWSFGTNDVESIRRWGIPTNPAVSRLFDGRGWPLISQWCEYRATNQSLLFESTRSIRLHADHRKVLGFTLEPALPLHPNWPGFAINTVFYAAVLWGLFAVPLALRKRRRIKRGWCPKCAYDLRGAGRAPDSTVCPECGLSVEPTP